MINKPFDAIDKSDIDNLVAERIAEKRTIEYKKSLPESTDPLKREFLADVSSFANAAGGDILYGIVEERDIAGKGTGRPQSTPGLASINTNDVILRLENIIRDGIEPRIPLVQTKPIEGFVEGPVIMIRIPKSWSSPHMVKFNGTSRFYSRNSAGKYQLDVSEIRTAFVSSEVLPERIRNFRVDRLAKIISGETPAPLYPHPKIVLHVLPVSAFVQPSQVNLHQVAQQPLSPLFYTGGDTRYNLDGFLTYMNRLDTLCDTYVQVFRNGAIEAVNAYALRELNQNSSVPIFALEKEVIHKVTPYFNALRTWEIPPPVFLMLTLLGVKNRVILPPGERFFPDEMHLIDREDLMLPEILVDDFDAHPSKILRPIFDALWQSAGWSGSLHYTPTGRWQGEK